MTSKKKEPLEQAEMNIDSPVSHNVATLTLKVWVILLAPPLFSSQFAH